MATLLLKTSRVVLFLALLAIAVPSFAQYPSPPYPPPFDYGRFPPIRHAVPFHPQDTMVWCWVAAAKMICEFYDRQPVPSQCEMLQIQYRAPCCENPAPCSRAGHIAEISALIRRFGGRFSNVAPPANAFVLYGALRRGPIVLHTRQGAGHFVVATGIRVIPTPAGPLAIVSINDPFFGQYEVDFPNLMQAWIAALVVY